MSRSTYAYDALNRRVSKISPAREEYFVYDGSRVVMELYDPDKIGIPATILIARSFGYNSYIDAPLVMVAEEGAELNLGPPTPQPKKAYYLQDRRFSVVAMSHEADGVIERYRYEAFGAMTVYVNNGSNWVTQNSTNRANQSRIDNPFGFTGRRYDPETATGGLSHGGGAAINGGAPNSALGGGGGATVTGGGLWHYRNRMYSSNLGRFMQRDPAGYVDGFNLYAYVRSNPLAFVDAFGLAKRGVSSQFNRMNMGSSLNWAISHTQPNLLGTTVPIDTESNFNNWRGQIAIPNSTNFQPYISTDKEKPSFLQSANNILTGTLNGLGNFTEGIRDLAWKTAVTREYSLDIAARAIAGTPGHIVSGDIFDPSNYNRFETLARNEEILISLNGIYNDFEDAKHISQSIKSFNVRSDNRARISNGTHFFGGKGDLVQIGTNELTGITGTDLRAAKQIVMAYNALIKARTENPVIRLMAHSQGTMTGSRALDIIEKMPDGPEILASISYYGVGPERLVSNERGLRSAVNFVTTLDPVPHMGNFGPHRRLEDKMAGRTNDTYNMWVTGPGHKDPDNPWAAHGWRHNFEYIFNTPGQLNLVHPAAVNGDRIGPVTFQDYEGQKP